MATAEEYEKQIVDRTNKMVASANSQFSKYEADQKKKNVKVSKIRLFVDKDPDAETRTPEEQVEDVLGMGSWTCNSSHMLDAARHVVPEIDGKPQWKGSAIKDSLEEDQWKQFVKVYADAMNAQNLRNYGAAKGFLPMSNDPFHMELPDARMNDSDPRVQKCLLLYAQATRGCGRKRNTKFEKENPAAKEFLKNYDKEHPQEDVGVCAESYDRVLTKYARPIIATVGRQVAKVPKDLVQTDDDLKKLQANQPLSQDDAKKVETLRKRRDLLRKAIEQSAAVLSDKLKKALAGIPVPEEGRGDMSDDIEGSVKEQVFPLGDSGSVKAEVEIDGKTKKPKAIRIKVTWPSD